MIVIPIFVGLIPELIINQQGFWNILGYPVNGWSGGTIFGGKQQNGGIYGDSWDKKKVESYRIWLRKMMGIFRGFRDKSWRGTPTQMLHGAGIFTNIETQKSPSYVGTYDPAPWFASGPVTGSIYRFLLFTIELVVAPALGKHPWEIPVRSTLSTEIVGVSYGGFYQWG